MTEAELLGRVTAAAQARGILVFHARDSRRALGRGFPDLVLAGHHGLLFRELKADQGRLSPEQWAWGERLFAAGANWGVWWPHDWRSGTVEGVLRAIA